MVLQDRDRGFCSQSEKTWEEIIQEWDTHMMVSGMKQIKDFEAFKQYMKEHPEEFFENLQ